MMPFDARQQERFAFLYELYMQSASDARQSIPYEVLIDALGFDECVTKSIQHELQRAWLVELTTVPQVTTVSRPIMQHAHRQQHQQMMALTPQGMRLLEEIIAARHMPP
jgi:hypothetical protein